jgi:TrmH family RNA methyltransferase
MISKNQIKHIKALHLKKFRDEQECFIAEGVKVVDEIVLHRPELINEVFATSEYYKRNKTAFEKKDIVFYEISEEELGRISMQNNPNQALAVCSYFEEEKSELDLRKNFSFYLDDIRDPGNLGTILRIADWFGVKEVFCSPNSTDIYNPKSIQAAMGAFLRVKVNYVDLNELLNGKFPVYGAVLNGKNIYSEKLRNGLILIGNEANGITPQNLKSITDPITIPSHSNNQTESLNAAMATSIICSEFFRQLILK